MPMSRTKPSRLAIWPGTKPARMLASSGDRVDDKGRLHRSYVKEILRAGHYVHPTAGWEADITVAKLDQYATAFREMRKNGVDVEVTVDHSGSARDVIGYITDMWVDGESLMATHDLIGEDNFALAETVHNTSVEIAGNFVDGKGTQYGEAITANSIVQAPVMPGQAKAPFKVAASLDAARAFARKHSIPLFEPEAKTNMDPILALIQQITGAKDVTEANGHEVLQAWWSKAKPKLDRPDEPVKASLDPDVAEDRAEATAERLDGLVKAGKVTADCAKALSAVLVGEPGKRNTVALSRGSAGEAPIARAVIDALSKNEPKVLAEAASALSKLSRAAGAPPADGGADKPLTAEQHKAAWGL